MRTKQLFVTAVLGAATSVGAMAQVYSANVVGYVNLELPMGFSMIANPLNVMSGGNALADVIPTAPIGTQVLVWNGAGFDAAITYFGPEFGGWVDDSFAPASVDLNPGGGVFVNMAEAGTLTFVGEVPQGDLTKDLAVGFQIVSKLVPDSATFDEAGFPAVIGDQVMEFTGTGYIISTYFGPEFGGWVDDAFAPLDLTPAAGRAVFVNKAEAGTWNRTFNVE